MKYNQPQTLKKGDVVNVPTRKPRAAGDEMPINDWRTGQTVAIGTVLRVVLVGGGIIAAVVRIIAAGG